MTVARSRRTFLFFLFAAMSCAGTASLRAAAAPAAGSVPVVMLSDIHFDPFHDPAKFERLRNAPVSEWQKILSEPDTPTQPADFAKLVKGCVARGFDTPWTLLESSLEAARTQSPHALFVTVSGDLVVHKFECKFNLLARDAAPGELSAFAAKTVAYVAGELHRTFPAAPVYLALGNNDSGCADYREDPDSAFLQTAAESFGNTIGTPAARKDLLQIFPAGGSYSVALPKPVVRGRLIVLQDLFLSSEYAGCNGKPDAAPGTAQLEWLRTELAAAHAHHEQVWVMAHIPPGVNQYSTTTQKRDVCGGQPPVMFLRDEQLVDVLTAFSADIRLVLFGHTHNDEMRLLQTAPAPGAKSPSWVAAKLVPAITPINGNMPAFTLAEVDPRTAVLKDYEVVAASNSTGVATDWHEEYRFSTTYHRAAYTPEDVAAIIAQFSAEKTGAAPLSNAYEQNFMVNGGLRAIAIRVVWPQYVCSLSNDTAAAYRSCVCPAKP